ncbi:hypothetical protein [Saliphagus infecundisoli]|uniref:Uncharacterized protein n=1 Tax=Saliphagus infecundisoli TaxID=1849069 RepID=A0ABD5QKX1_9EURY|nr:hypothetical protein [Saliphagus infecundisoli]
MLRASAETLREATDEQWADAIEDSRFILGDSLDPADVAAEFDDVPCETMANLCREAVLQVKRDRPGPIFQDFRAALDALDADDEDNEEYALSAGDFLETMLDDVDGVNGNTDSHRDERDGKTAASPSTNSQSSLSSADTDFLVEPAPLAMDRDALEDEVPTVNESRPSKRMSSCFRKLQTATSRFCAVHFGNSSVATSSMTCPIFLKPLNSFELTTNAQIVPCAKEPFRTARKRSREVISLDEERGCEKVWSCTYRAITKINR